MEIAQVRDGKTLLRCPGAEPVGDGWLAFSDVGHLYFRENEFDSSVFNLRAARVDSWKLPSDETVVFLRKAFSLAAEHFDHITWKIPASQEAIGCAGGEAGLRRIVVNRSFSGLLLRSSKVSPIPIRRAEAEDRAALIRLCAEVFAEGTRFHRDPDLPQELVPKLYRKWMENSLDGYADLVLVSGESDITGFITARYTGDTAYIDLLGVAPAARRTGTASALFDALAAEAAPEVTYVAVDTEADNSAAVAFYAAKGLVVGACTHILQGRLEAL